MCKLLTATSTPDSKPPLSQLRGERAGRVITAPEDNIIILVQYVIQYI